MNLQLEKLEEGLLQNLESESSFSNYFKLGAYYCEEETNFIKAKPYINEALLKDTNSPEANHYWSLILLDEAKRNPSQEKEILNEAFIYASIAYELKPELEDIFHMGVSPIKKRLFNWN